MFFAKSLLKVQKPRIINGFCFIGWLIERFTVSKTETYLNFGLNLAVSIKILSNKYGLSIFSFFPFNNF